MASDGTMTLPSSTHDHELDYDDDIDNGYDHHQPHQVVNLSRLSVCTSRCMYGPEHNGDESARFYEIDGAGSMNMFMSQLSIESFKGDEDDEEFSDQKKNYKFERAARLSSSSDSEPGYYSLPTTPPRIRKKSRGRLPSDRQVTRVKDYATENEARKFTRDSSMCRRKRRKRRRIGGHRWLLNGADNYNTASNNWMSKKKGEDNMTGTNNNGYSGGESESGGVMLIARPKGGRRSLCMDLEEVKACRDLGFELEHERMLEMPSRVSISAGSTADTSSGGNSPIAHWRISSPGDDPRDVKARLKIWAQAVALASAFRPTS